MEVVAANQTQLTASVQSHDALIAETSNKIAQLTDLTLRIGRIVEEQGRHMDEMGKQTDQRLKALAEAQAHTEERLNALINVVARYFSNGHD